MGRKCVAIVSPLALIASMAGAPACSRKAKGEAHVAVATSAAPATSAMTKTGGATTLELLSLPGACLLGHRGTVFDFGEEGPQRWRVARDGEAPSEVVEREGATWMRVRERTL